MTRDQLGIRYAAIGAAAAWISLGLQFFITNALVLSQGRSIQDSLALFFSFYTILTNLLVAIAFTVAALRPAGWFRVFSRPFVLSGIAPNIAVVAIVYNLILRQLWHPTGWALVADELLHVVMPVVFIIYWWRWVPKSALRWRDALIWASYPLGYFVYALARGAASGTYPYPFIDVGVLGYGAVLQNGVGLLIGFVGLATLFIAVGRWKHRTLSNSMP